jgi:mycofactocin precursor
MESTRTREERAVQTLDSTEPVESPAPTEAALVEDDLLVEEISIDGMCGVY